MRVREHNATFRVCYLTPATPHYALDEVKTCVAAGDYRTTNSALSDMAELGLDETDVRTCVAGLTLAMCHKSMPATKIPGLWQDVYRAPYCGMVLYVKVQIQVERGKRKVAVIVSFKEK